MVIGSGLLGLPGVVIDEVGSVTALYGWFGIVIFMLPMLMVFTRLGLRYPKVGGLRLRVQRGQRGDGSSVTCRRLH